VIDDPRVDQLLEELLDSGGTPEEVCSSCPELLPQVRAGFHRLRLLEDEISALFPPSDQPERARRMALSAAELPEIPGYEVEAMLGHGGVGVVYRARHLRLKRPVALKMLLSGPFAQAGELERFLREAEAVAGLRHPNVVQVYDVGDVDGRPYLSMEYVEGGSLARRLAGTPLTPQEATLLMATLAGAVQAAHANGIVHRDLKPSNVLLTADGVPKISDFGLARRLEGETGITRTGVAVGTPSYMAPEQALGQPDALGPAVDVYALGAILYEVLTGRPPFRAATAASTVQQVVSQEPALPSRLNDKVPRDLETICLKCLEKDPQRRYGSAAEFAEDLVHFQRGEPILARRAGPVERVVKWIRRNRSLAAAIVIGVLFLNVLVGVGGWVLFERSALKRAVGEDLDQVVLAQKEQKWDQARTALARAKGRLGEGGSEELRRRADQLERELVLAAKLEDIILNTDVSSNQRQLNGPRYEEVLREAGIFDGSEEPEGVVAARIRATGVAATILEALDEWAMHERKGGRQGWLLEVARLADENPASRKIRDAKPWENRPALEEFARSTPLKDLSVPFLHFLGFTLQELGGDAVTFYRSVHRAHVTSCLANGGLAYLLYLKGDYEGSLPYFQAAIAIRPTQHRLRHIYGTSLYHLRKWDLALVEFEEAQRLVPDSVEYNESIGTLLLYRNRPAQAERLYRQVLETQPNNSTYLAGLARSLRDQGRLDEALDICRRVVAAYPKEGFGYRLLKDSCLSLRRWDEARDAWKQWLATDPHDPHGNEAWDGYAELCLYLGDEVEYRRTRTELLKRFGETTAPQIAERTSRACLLLAATDDELKQATAMIDRALTVENPNLRWLKPYLRFVKALAEYRAGRWEKALDLLRGETLLILSPAPPLLLAMVQHRHGQTDAARKTFDAAVASYNWDPAKVTNREAWMYHLLRREAESVLASKP